MPLGDSMTGIIGTNDIRMVNRTEHNKFMADGVNSWVLIEWTCSLIDKSP